MPSATSQAVVAAFVRFAQLLHNLEYHFLNCDLLTVYNIGIECEPHFRKGWYESF